MKEITLYISLNSKCNLACRYCYIKKNLKEQLNIRKIKQRISYFFNKNNFLFINFCGGEPLMSFTTVKETCNLYRKGAESVWIWM